MPLMGWTLTRRAGVFDSNESSQAETGLQTLLQCDALRAGSLSLSLSPSLSLSLSLTLPLPSLPPSPSLSLSLSLAGGYRG